MRRTKKVFKLFYIFDLEKEENWLREMANKGWFFEKVNYLGVYTFIKGPCTDTIYKIDFNKNINDLDEYYDLFSESGWEFIYKIRFFKYFRYVGDAASYKNEPDIYNEPMEQIIFLRKWLILFLIAYGLQFVSIFSLSFLQNARYGAISLILITILLLSFILVRFINSYIILKRKLKRSTGIEYYSKNDLRKVYSSVSLLIAPILICVIWASTLTNIYTVSGSEKAIKAKILKYDRTSLYPMKKIDYIESRDMGNYRVCLYGSNERIGIIALEKVLLNRYKVITDFSGGLPSKEFIIKDYLILGETKYSVIYGKDENDEIKKLIITYDDGTSDEIMRDNFIGEDKSLMIIQKQGNKVKQIKLYNKDNADITDRYIKYGK
ncbi:DUF2812 domain-containing protein [Clostridium sp. 'White wine YQ']|uniref:DUF2812 domain-containing protein n=1 Tax=Clostridium sp. 'White wine YQ' TaxID=3027474 RepID=UPI00236704A7|nr:DUF2812 domain-containing protein [Clostridium sp. 'White wine YQ']MDD7793457.1 DUF2812 domain-containing protein [Clostridium sp. 'White wine YQ']